jgi:hypothetical protein
MWRPRSYIGRLQFRDILLHYSGENQSLSGLVLHIRKPKEGQQKTIHLGLLNDSEQGELCLVRCVERFINGTRSFRTSLAEDHTLLLTYLNKPQEIPPSSIQSSTVASWVKSHMSAAGSAKEYPAHSIRAATSTKAVQKGVSIQKSNSMPTGHKVLTPSKNITLNQSVNTMTAQRSKIQFFRLRTVPLRSPKRRQQVLC